MLPTMTTTFEKGVLQGMQQGIQQGMQQGKREDIRLLLEKRFGPLGEEMRQRLDDWPADRLNELLAAVDAPSLAALGLEG